jgi:hypothetical protein
LNNRDDYAIAKNHDGSDVSANGQATTGSMPDLTDEDMGGTACANVSLE